MKIKSIHNHVIVTSKTLSLFMNKFIEQPLALKTTEQILVTQMFDVLHR